MAFYDWNHDGKKDLIDDYIEYNIYQNCMKNGNTPREPRRTTSAKGFWIVFLVSCVVGGFNELLGAMILGGYLLILLMS